jgi:hypothetical protein
MLKLTNKSRVEWASIRVIATLRAIINYKLRRTHGAVVFLSTVDPDIVG